MELRQDTKIGFITVGTVVILAMLTFYGTGIYLNIKKIKEMKKDESK